VNPLIHLEERKRDRTWNAQERWRLIQEAMTWAEAQSTVRRNIPRNRLEEQARKLAFMAKAPAISRHQTLRPPARPPM
jgi:hypothetical protein